MNKSEITNRLEYAFNKKPPAPMHVKLRRAAMVTDVSNAVGEVLAELVGGEHACTQAKSIAGLREGIKELADQLNTQLTDIRAEIREELGMLESSLQAVLKGLEAARERPATGEHGHDDSGPE